MKTTAMIVAATVLCAGLLIGGGKKTTPVEAEAMVKKAVAFYKENGKEKAFAAFNDQNGKFTMGDLYIVVYDLTGKCVAHGANPKQIGKDVIGMKDPDGKAFVKECVEIAKTRGKGWQNYKWSNPSTGTIEPKTMYLESVDNLIFGASAYTK
jgi:signal transduction histidine kinase